MRYAWYQTSNRDYRFESWEYAKKNGFKISDYFFVQGDNLGIPDNMIDEEVLDRLYYLMNTNQNNHPGVRSMSMSDVVTLMDDSGWNIRAYYCDDAGWVRLDFWEDM